ncbi:4'-phosphopantetheinyl transferase family protein [Micropruina sp.]|uniref:4'-phosphopantetheinyl transferase family protein n=1 Tax=Micropruina sp. TaxID=2737536 RepID=UPI0039E5F7C8
MTSDPGHCLALQLASNLVGADVRQLRHRCSRCRSGEHGVPFADFDQRRIALSISRAPGVIAAAASLDGSIGIDIERHQAAGFDGFATVALHPDEPAPASSADATRLWVRKEAVLKALGSGLRIDPRTVRLATSDPPRLLEWPDPRPPEHLELRDLSAPDGYTAALAGIGGSGLAYTQVSIRPATSPSV